MASEEAKEDILRGPARDGTNAISAVEDAIAQICRVTVNDSSKVLCMQSEYM